MPVPAVVGIPWLAGVIGGLFGSVVSFFAKYVTKRIAIVAAALVVMVGITAAFFAAIVSLMAGVSASLPGQFTTAIGLFMPPNARECVAAVLTAYTLRWAYDWNTKILQWKLF